MDRMITWLHISDLHTNTPETGWDADLVLKTLINDLRDLQEKQGLHPDLIFFTGDAVWGHLDEGGKSIQQQFEDAWLFFESIREAFSPSVPIENFFIIPGNHDVNRTVILDAVTKELDGLVQGDHQNAIKTVTERIKKADKEWKDYMKRLDDYGAFLKDTGYNPCLQDRERHIFGVTRDIRGTKVGIAGLNSAWSCGRKDERGKLWLAGHWQIQELRPKFDDASIRIGLIHHPFNWLTEVEHPELDSEVQRTFDFLLHGHEHQSWVDHLGKFTRIAAGACYKSSGSRKNGYNFVRLNLDDGTSEVWLRTYYSGRGGWAPFLDAAETDERGVWSLDNLSWLLSKTDESSRQRDKIQKELAIPVDAEPTPAEEHGVFGREDDLRKLSKALAQKSVVTVWGMIGIGKTWLIRQALRDEPYNQYDPVRFTASAAMSFEDLYRQIAGSLGHHGENPTPPDLSSPLGVAMFGQFATNAQPCIIHIEAAHHLLTHSHPDQPRFLTLLRAIAEGFPIAKIILESREKPAEDLPESGFHQSIRLHGLDEVSIKRYFQRPLATSPETGWELADNEVEAVYRRLGGDEHSHGAHPLAMFLLVLVANGTDCSPYQVLQRHQPQFVSELYNELFQELYKQVLTSIEQRLLRMCALYRDRIPDAHADRLNAFIENSDAFDSLVRRSLLNPTENGDYYYLHTLIAELTQRQIDVDDNESFDNHECIAKAWLLHVRQNMRPSLPNILAASEAVYHLLEAQRYDLLDELKERLLSDAMLRRLDELSVKLFRNEQHEDNRCVLELLVALDPSNHKAHRFLGEALERLEGRGNETALNHYQTAWDLDHFPPYLANLGRCFLARNEPERLLLVIDAFDEETYSKMMANDYVVAIYCDCLASSGDEEKASQIRQQQIALNTRNPAFYNDEADYLLNQGKYPEAAAVLDAANEVGVTNEYIISVRARILEAQGDGERASQMRQQQIVSKTRNPVFYNDEANYLLNQGRYKEATDVLDVANKISATDQYTIAIQARILEAQGDEEGASQMRQQQIASKTRNPAIYNDEANYLLNQEKYPEATAVLDVTNEVGVTDEYTTAIRAKILKGQSDEEEASQIRQPHP